MQPWEDEDPHDSDRQLFLANATCPAPRDILICCNNCREVSSFYCRFKWNLVCTWHSCAVQVWNINNKPYTVVTQTFRHPLLKYHRYTPSCGWRPHRAIRKTLYRRGVPRGSELHGNPFRVLSCCSVSKVRYATATQCFLGGC